MDWHRRKYVYFPNFSSKLRRDRNHAESPVPYSVSLVEKKNLLIMVHSREYAFAHLWRQSKAISSPVCSYYHITTTPDGNSAFYSVRESSQNTGTSVMWVLRLVLWYLIPFPLTIHCTTNIEKCPCSQVESPSVCSV